MIQYFIDYNIILIYIHSSLSITYSLKNPPPLSTNNNGYHQHLVIDGGLEYWKSVYVTRGNSVTT